MSKASADSLELHSGGEQGRSVRGQSHGEIRAYRIADGMLIRLTHNKWEEGVSSREATLKIDFAICARRLIACQTNRNK